MLNPKVPYHHGEQPVDSSLDFAEDLHAKFVQELRLRRMKHLGPNEMIGLLYSYVQSGTLARSNSADSSQARFIAACDKVLAQESEQISASDMDMLFSLYDMMRQQGCENCLTTKLLLKLQRRILKLYDWADSSQSQADRLSINTFAFICRIFAEEAVTMTDLFEELALSLDTRLEELDESGFVNTYVALMTHRIHA